MTTFNTRKLKLTALVAMIGASVAFAGANTAMAKETAFTFSRAEFMPSDQSQPAAQAFVARRLPAGIPLQVARERLTQARMGCGQPAAIDGSVTCQYSELVGSDGGTLGDDIWTVRLAADQAGTVTAATLTHNQTGFRH